MDDLLACGAVAGLLVITGIVMMVTGRPGLLHGYHYATTPPEKIPALSRWCGAGLILCGMGVLLLAFDGRTAAVGVAVLVAGLVATLTAIIHYNGRLVSTGALGGTLRLLSPRARVIACAFIGLAVAALCALPAIRMIALGDVSALHQYHYAHVAPEDMRAFAAAEGASMLLLAASVPVCMAAGAGLALARPARRAARIAMAVGAAMLCAGLAGLIGFILLFNGSLMG